jgi:hypothetical protein
MQSSSLPLYGFRIWVVALCIGFFWTRLDFTDRIYFFGDANWIIGMAELIQETGNWDTNVFRLLSSNKLEVEQAWRDYRPEVFERKSGYGYAHSGYVTITAATGSLLDAIGLEDISHQRMLRFMNIVFHLITCWLVYRISKQLFRQRFFCMMAVTVFVFFPLAVMEAHYERAESWIGLLATLILYCVIKLPDKPVASYAVIGAAIGLSFATKVNQLFLGIIPALTLLHFLLYGNPLKNDPPELNNQLRQRFLSSFKYGMVVLLSMTIAAFVNAPYMFFNLDEHFIGVYRAYLLHRDPYPPYLNTEYTYFNQLGLIVNYFLSTLGFPIVSAVILGLFALLTRPAGNNRLPRLCISITMLILVLFFASNKSFFERSFSSVESYISILAASGLFYLYQIFYPKIKNQHTMTLAAVLAIPIMLFTPAKLDYVFVSNYIHGNGNQKRLDFQNLLKKDFDGFWYKNVHETYNYRNMLPERPPKAPRIYIIKDYNDPWTRTLTDNMSQNGFIKVGEYRSEFYGMQLNNLTMYHQQHSYHYFILEEEVPEGLEDGYFKGNF